MRHIPLIAQSIVLMAGVSAHAQDFNSELTAAARLLTAGDASAAILRLEPLLAQDALAPSAKAQVRRLAAKALHVRGEDHFRHARMADAVTDFNRQVALQPQLEAEHWQRGIAYYYAEQYDDGARQFKLHQSVNPQDVENAAWHFLCLLRRGQGAADDAAREQLIEVTSDSRSPMAEIHRMFAGQLAPEQVLAAGRKSGETAEFYAELYVGLYYEALGREEDSRRHVRRAAGMPAAQNNYMGDVARVHVALREKAGDPPD